MVKAAIMPGRAVRAVLYLSLATILFGCGGSGGSGGGTGTTVGGTVTTDTFSVPAGTTTTVSSDLVVNAAKGIDIYGTLNIPQGVSVSLYTPGTLSSTGTIQPAPAGTALKTRDAGAPPAPIVMIAGTVNIEVLHMPAGANLYVVGNSPTSTVTFTGLFGARGIDSKSPDAVGGDAPSVEIGTAAAITAAGKLGYGTPTQPAQIVGGDVIGGDGGTGYIDTKGTLAGNILTGTGTKGGRGGDVRISAKTSVTLASAQGGAGGQGGGVLLSFSLQPATGVGAAGTSIVENTGSGGDGANVSVSPAPTQGSLFNGIFGLAGNANATAQDGGPGGDGGDVTLNAGIDGSFGTGGTNPTFDHRSVGITLRSGAGGDSEDYSHSGGRGGDITALQNGAKIKYASFTFDVTDGKGGAGYPLACPASPTSSAGTAGGRGGNVHTLSVAYTLSSVEPNGGDGGSGAFAGVGGEGGIDLDTSAILGLAGKKGGVCGGSTTYGVSQTIPAGGFVNSVSFCAADQLICTIGSDSPQTSFQFVTTSGQTTQVSVPDGLSPALDGLCQSVPSAHRTTGPNLMFMALGDGKVAIINEDTKTNVGTITVPVAQGVTNCPRTLTYDPATGKLFVDSGKGVAIFDTKNNNALLTTISTGQQALSMTINTATHMVYAGGLASDFISNNLYVIDGTQNTLAATVSTSPNLITELAANPATNKLYATVGTNGSILVFNGATNAVTKTITGLNNPAGIAVDPILNRFYVTTNNGIAITPHYAGFLVKFDGSTDTQMASLAVGTFPRGVTVDSSSNKIYVANEQDSTISQVTGGN